MPEFRWGFSGAETTKENIILCAPDGWKNLVSKLIDDLVDAGWNGVVYQVKEKFGGLRFYIDTGNDKIHTLINDAELKSYSICDVCGKPGKRMGSNWVRTRCDEHSVP